MTVLTKYYLIFLYYYVKYYLIILYALSFYVIYIISIDSMFIFYIKHYYINYILLQPSWFKVKIMLQ